MRSVFDNGGIIGKSLDPYSTNQYETQQPATITYVGGKVVAHSGTTSDIVVTLTGLTGGIASAPSVNDIVIVGFCIGNWPGFNPGFKILNYSQIAELDSFDSNDAFLQVGYKIMLNSVDSSFTIDGGSGSVDVAAATAIHVWRNVDIYTPLDVLSTTSITTSTAAPTPPSITPVSDSSVIVSVGGSGHTRSVMTFTAPYLSNFITVGAGDADGDASIGMGSILWNGLSYSPAQWGLSGSDSDQFASAAVTLALRPTPALGNYKNSGIWGIQTAFNNL